MKIPRPSALGQRTPWLVTTLLILMVVLVPLLAWFQFQWTGEASQAEVFRMRSNLRAATVRMVTDFERAVNLDQEPGLPPDSRQIELTDAQALERASAQFLSWAALTENPGLVMGLWVVSDGLAWQTLPDGVHWTGPVSASSVPPAVYRASLPLTRNPNRRILIDVNPLVLLKTVVPRLVAATFSDDGALPGYVVSVRDTATGNLLWTNSPTSPQPTAPPEIAVGLLGSSDRFSFGLAATLELFDNLGPAPQFRVSRPGRSEWTLEVRHQSGSLEAAADRVRWLNFGGTVTLLVLLTGGFLILYRLYSRNRLAVRAQQDFVASVSHELKSPLAVLRAAAENLKEGVVSQPGQAQRYGERMLSEADRLLMLTDNILRYAGLESESQRSELRELVDVGELVSERFAAWQPAYAAKNAALILKPATTGVTIHGHRAELAAITDNLLSNALKHGTTASEPKVVLAVGVRQDRRGPQAWLTVEDNGKGLAAREHRKVFEPFYRPLGTTVSGVGLGLSLVARLAAAGGGRVELRSAPGAGARFEVSFPAASAKKDA